MLARAALAAALVLGAGAALRLTYPLTALSLALPLLAALAGFAAASRSVLARHRALRDAVVRPGTVLARLLTGRLRAALAGAAAALAAVPASYFAVTAAPAECAAAAAAVPLLALLHSGLTRWASRQMQPAFATAFATNLTTFGGGALLVAALAWLGYAVVPPPAELAAADLAGALAAIETPPHALGWLIGALRTADVALWWAMDRTGWHSGLLTALFLIRNALVGLALARLTADISSLVHKEAP